MPSVRRLLRTTLWVAGAALAASEAGAQQEFPQTLYWGSGLIDIPVAWVSPLTGDFAINYSGKRFEVDPTLTKLNYSDRMNSQLTISAALFGRVEGGIAWFSSNPEYGFFARGLLLREEDLEAVGGIVRWLPALAVGARNIGEYDRIDRFGVGYRLLPPGPGEPDQQHEPDPLHQNFRTSGTLYGVATKGVSLNQLSERLPDVDLSLTVGYGNKLFKDDGGLGSSYAKHSTGGLFYGVKTDFRPVPSVLISLMGENNAWDFNLGASVLYRGLRAGIYLTEVGAGSADVDPNVLPSSFYNYRKVAFTLGWQSNLLALIRGDFLQNRAAALERQRDQLLAEISERQRRVAALELEINRYEAQNLLELEQRRAAAETALRQERELLRRLEERLKRVEQQRGTPPSQQTTPPTPPQP